MEPDERSGLGFPPAVRFGWLRSGAAPAASATRSVPLCIGLDAVTVGNKFHIAEDAQRGADALAGSSSRISRTSEQHVLPLHPSSWRGTKARRSGSLEPRTEDRRCLVTRGSRLAARSARSHLTMRGGALAFGFGRLWLAGPTPAARIPVGELRHYSFQRLGGYRSPRQGRLLIEPRWVACRRSLVSDWLARIGPAQAGESSEIGIG
jgi:hypothetical protein